MRRKPSNFMSRFNRIDWSKVHESDQDLKDVMLSQLSILRELYEEGSESPKGLEETLDYNLHHFRV